MLWVSRGRGFESHPPDKIKKVHLGLWCNRCARRTENPEVAVRFGGVPLDVVERKVDLQFS